MKIDRHGRAKILTQAEIQLLFNEVFTLYLDQYSDQTTERVEVE